MATLAEPKQRKVSADEAREVAEAAREQEWAAPSFVRDLFLGKLRMDLIHPYPEQDPDEIARAKPFLDKLERFVREDVDSDKIDREGENRDEVIDGLRKLGAVGIKIPREYGGLGLSQLSYMKAIELVSSVDGSLTALLSAHQSIGLPQPLKLFGTEDQKKKFFPRLAKGAISAFALTEENVGSDPAAMETTAILDDDEWVLNGEKLWCTNGTKAELLVVMARTPSTMVKGREKKQITAFIVETDWPGVEVVYRCHFMGLKALYSGVIRFTNVRVPKENVLWGEGKGLKLALVTLNTGRLTLPISSVAAGKRCLEISRRWAAERVQWGRPIGQHDAIAQKLGSMASNTLAMEAVAGLGGLARSARFYGWWYPSRWIGWSLWPRYSEFRRLATHVRFVEHSCRRLARSVFHSMIRFGPKLELRQSVLFRLVDVAGELFAMAATCSRAQRMLERDRVAGARAVRLADLFCRQARRRVRSKFGGLRRNEDVPTYKFAQEILSGEHRWLERDIVELPE